jgi:hypothetical protein
MTEHPDSFLLAHDSMTRCVVGFGGIITVNIHWILGAGMQSSRVTRTSPTNAWELNYANIVMGWDG